MLRYVSTFILAATIIGNVQAQRSAAMMDNSNGNAGASNVYSPTSVTTADNRSGSANISVNNPLSLVVSPGQIGSTIMCVGKDSYAEPIGNVIAEGSAFGMSTTYDIPIATDPITGKKRYYSYYHEIKNRGELSNPRIFTINGKKVTLYEGIYFHERSWTSSDFNQKQIAVGGSSNGKSVAVNGGSISSSTTMQSRITPTAKPCWTNIELERDGIAFTTDDINRSVQQAALAEDLKRSRYETAAQRALLKKNPSTLPAILVAKRR